MRHLFSYTYISRLSPVIFRQLTVAFLIAGLVAPTSVLSRSRKYVTVVSSSSHKGSPPQSFRKIAESDKSRNAADAAYSTDRQVSDDVSQTRIIKAYGNLPLSFEANVGQISSKARFISRAQGFNLLLSPTEAIAVMSKVSVRGEQNHARSNKSDNRDIQVSAVKMKFEGANQVPNVVGMDELPGKSNYFIGNDPKRWQTNVSSYAKVKYEDVYPGTDVVFYGNQRQLEYDFILAPHADPENITLGFEGAQSLRIDRNGDLIISTTGGKMQQQKPHVYQEVDGLEQVVAGQYVLRGKNRIGFEIGPYDTGKPLIIDPVLSYSTYLGGSGTQDEHGFSIAVDSSGNSYVTGTTVATDFPVTAGSLQGNSAGLSDIFVTKLNPSGTARVYSTYLGGSNEEGGAGIESYLTVDSEGNVYLAGTTLSTNFPFTAGAYQTAPTILTGFPPQDVFISKLNAAGNALLYSTYLGGSSYDKAAGIAIDSAGNAYVTGNVPAINGLPPQIPFPLTGGAYQSTHDNWADTFITKLNVTGTALIYSTLLGGSSSVSPEGDYGCYDNASDIAVDASGYAYVVGTTHCSDFPVTAGAYDTQIGTPGYDAYITKLNTTGTALVYSTYFGGNQAENANTIAVDSSGNAYVGGYTESNDLPTTPGVIKTSLTGTSDGFITKLNATGSALIFSTYHGGSNHDNVIEMVLSGCGDIYVAGETTSTNFPTTVSALRTTLGGAYDGYVAKLDGTGVALLYSTYIGGTSDDWVSGIAIDSADNVYLTGSTYSTNYPVTTGAFRTTLNGAGDAFVTKLLLGDIAGNNKPVAPDATAGMGPYTPVTAEYHPGADADNFHPNAAIDPTVLPDRATEIWAKYYWPQGLPAGPHPLVVFLHGNHDTCGFGSNPRVDDNIQYTTEGKCTEKHITPFITSGTLGTPRNNFSGWVGMKVTIGAQPVTVRALGRLVLSGNTGAHALKIVRVSDNATITPSLSLATAGATPGYFKYAPLPSPVILAANTSYYVVSQEVSGGDSWYDSNTTVVSKSVGTVNGRVISKNSGWNTTGGVVGKVYGPTSFAYEDGTYSIAPSHRGYDYLANKLASFGYIVVSINANLGINAGVGYQYDPAYPDFPADPALIYARGRLVLRHLQLLSEWNSGGTQTPAALGVNFTGKIDLSNIGLMGHSRGGEGMRAAYNLYRDPGSPWPARIVSSTSSSFKGIFEIAPVDKQTARVFNADGVAWNVLLPACDGDIVQLNGVRVFDRMMLTASGEVAATPKSTFMVWGANHNFFNAQWQVSEWLSNDSMACIGEGNTPLFLNPTVTGTGYGSSQQQQTALSSVLAFFRANVGATANISFNQNFDPRYDLPAAVKTVTFVERGFTPSPNSSVTTVFEDFNQPVGVNSSGVTNQSSNITINHQTVPDHYYSTAAPYVDYPPLPPDSQILKAGAISWTSANSNTYFQSNWRNTGNGVDISSYATLDFRVARQSSSTDLAQPNSLNPSTSTNFSIQLVMDDDDLSDPLCLSTYADLRGPVGARTALQQNWVPNELHPIMQTVRIPLADFGGADLSRIRGIRFIYNKTGTGAIYIANIRLAR